MWKTAETGTRLYRISLVQQIIRKSSMIAVVVVAAALVALALATQVGVLLAQRAHPPKGRMVEVAGGNLHIVDIGPRDAVGPPIVMLHGASSNLEAMRQPVGERLARKHRV